MQLQFLEVLALGQPDVAALLGEQCEIEVRQTHVRLRGDRLADQALGAGGISALSAMTPSALRAEATLRVDLQRAAEQRLGAWQVAAIEPDLANLVADERILRVDRQVVLEAGQRRIVVAQPSIRLGQVEDREIVVGLQARVRLK